MTIGQILKTAAAALNSENATDIPRLEAEILLSGILKKPIEFLLAHGEKKLSGGQTAKFKLQISKRLKGEPIAYLTGRKEFYGLNFKINKNVLIPRPETELMIDEALKIAARISQHITFIDVGTGSGCIIIALAKLLDGKKKKFIGSDISPKVLDIAKQNAKDLGVGENIKFIRGDLLESITKILDSRFRGNDKKKLFNPKLIITANLPYGWKSWENNCSMDTIGLKHEPKIALYTGKNGLELYEKLFKQINCLIHNTKYKIQNTIILCEFDPRQTAKIKQLIKRELPDAKFQIKKDLNGLNRLVIIKLLDQSKPCAVHPLRADSTQFNSGHSPRPLSLFDNSKLVACKI